MRGQPTPRRFTRHSVEPSLFCVSTCPPQGLYQEKPKLPFVPGSECSGTVVECGRDVRTLKVGDKVGLCPSQL